MIQSDFTSNAHWDSTIACPSNGNDKSADQMENLKKNRTYEMPFST